MKTPVVLVAAALTVAILLTASLLIATGARGEEGRAVIGEMRLPNKLAVIARSQRVALARAR